MGALDKIQRGWDSSGRPVYGTRQNFEFYDRVNDKIGGNLVIVQGSWSNAAASAGTHLLAMCMDYRTWNLTTAQRNLAIRYGRDLMGTMYYRSSADGFDPHIHNNLIGDAPATWAAQQQVEQYKRGLDGLARQRRDRDSYRPARITNYKYLGADDMFTDKDRELLKRIHSGLSTFRKNEVERDQRDKKKFARIITALGGAVDELAKIEAQMDDVATKRVVRKQRERLLLALKDDPDVDGVDNPSDDFLAEENFG